MTEADAGFARLTPRERECLRLAGRMTSKDIARHLGISPHTVDERIGNAVKKLGAADRRAAARLLLAHEGAEALQVDVSALGTAFGGDPNSSGPQPTRVSPAAGPGFQSSPGDAASPGAGHPASVAAPATRSRSERGVAGWFRAAAEGQMTVPQRAATILLIAIVSLLAVMLLLWGGYRTLSLLQSLSGGAPSA